MCLQRGAYCLHMVQLMPLHPKTPSSLAWFKSRLVLPFLYWITQVVVEKRPLNGCNSCSTLQVFILLTLLALCAEQGLSICLSHHSTTIRRCGRFAAVGPADRRYRLIAEWPSLSSDCKQCHIVSWLRKLNKHTCSWCHEWPKSFGKMIYAMLRVLCWGYYEQLWLSYSYW